MAHYIQNTKSTNIPKELSNRVVEEISLYHENRYNIISSSLDKIVSTHPKFRKLLLFISMLDSQNIPKELLVKYDPSVGLLLINSLQKFSLITHNDDDSFSMHRSTHKSIKNWAKIHIHSEKNIQREIECLHSIVNKYLEKNDIIFIRKIFPHLETFLNHKNLSKKQKINLYYICGLSLFKLTKSNLAKKYFEKSAENNNVNLPDSILYLSIISRYEGKNKKALLLLEKAYKLFKQANNHEKLLELQIHKANLYVYLNDFKFANQLFSDACKIYLQSYPKSTKTAWALGSFGRFYRVFGLYDEGKKMLQQSYQISSDNSDDFISAWCLEEMAVIEHELGNYKKAKVLFHKSYSKYCKIYSKYHYTTLWPMSKLLELYNLTNKQKNNNRFYIFVSGHQVMKKGLGIDYSLWFYTNIGRIYKELGQYKEAQRFLEKLIDDVKSKYGENNVFLAKIMQDLAYIYLEQHKLSNAQDVILSSLKILQSYNHPLQYICFELLADLYCKKQRKADANLNFQISLKLAMQFLPEDSEHIKRIKSKISMIKEEGSD